MAKTAVMSSSELKGLRRLTLVVPERKTALKNSFTAAKSFVCRLPGSAFTAPPSRRSSIPAALRAIRGVPAGKHHMSSQECRLSAAAWVEVRASVHTLLIIHRTSSLANKGRNCSFVCFLSLSLSLFQTHLFSRRGPLDQRRSTTERWPPPAHRCAGTDLWPGWGGGAWCGVEGGEKKTGQRQSRREGGMREAREEGGKTNREAQG